MHIVAVFYCVYYYAFVNSLCASLCESFTGSLGLSEVRGMHAVVKKKRRTMCVLEKKS